MEKKPRLLDLTPEEIERRIREQLLAEEAQRVAERKLVRKTRQQAARRFAEANAERRARAHRLIRLGAEVEASGVADLVGHDPEAVFGMLVALVENTRATGQQIPVEQFAEIGRERREKIAAAPSPSAQTTAGNRRRKGRQLPTGRTMIRFPSPPPELVRRLLRALDYRWRLGLRAWVGNEPLTETAEKYVRDFGGQVLPGPDASA